MVKKGVKKERKKNFNLVRFLIIGLLILFLAFFTVKLFFTGKVTETLTQSSDNSPPLCKFHSGDSINLVDANSRNYKIVVRNLSRSILGWSRDLLVFSDFYSGTSIYTAFVSNTSTVSTGNIILGGISYPVFLEGMPGISSSKYNVTIFSVSGAKISCDITACTPATCTSKNYNCGTWSDGCSGTLNCGTCGTEQTCNSNGICTSSIIPPYSPNVVTKSAVTETYVPVPVIGDVGTISKGTYNKINGVSIFVTDIIQDSPLGNQNFTTFIAGSDINLMNINSPVKVDLNGKNYTIKLVSTLDNIASINISNSSTNSETEQIEKYKYLPYNNFTDLNIIQKGGYVIIGNESSKEIFKLFDVGYSTLLGNMQMALFSNILTGELMNVTWSGYGNFIPPNVLIGGFLVVNSKYYLVIVQGKGGIDSFIYNVTIEPHVYPPRYVFYRGYNVIYKTMNRVVAFVKDITSTTSSPVIIGTEMFLSSDSNKTKFVIYGKSYSIELLDSNSTDATFKITDLKGTVFIDETPKGCTLGTTKQKDCSSQSTACITYQSVTETCLASGVWDNPPCNSFVYAARGTSCNSDGWHSCDGSGTCQGWSGTGCNSCPWGSSSSSLCNVDTSKYTFRNSVGSGWSCWSGEKCLLITSNSICKKTTYGMSGCCKKIADSAWQIKPK